MPVGSFPPNASGLHDMHDNVWEWCQDAWPDPYDGTPQDGSAREGGGGVSRVARGGSWANGPAQSRAAFRRRYGPVARGGLVGFRWCCASPIVTVLGKGGHRAIGRLQEVSRRHDHPS